MLNFFTLLEVVGDAGTGTTAGTDATTATMSGAESILGLVLPLLLMVVVFYFLLIRPQKKKDKAVKNMLAALKPGDRICTIGGIYGTISRLKDDSVYIIAGADQKEMCLTRWAIRSVEDAPLENDSEPLV